MKRILLACCIALAVGCGEVGDVSDFDGGGSGGDGTLLCGAVSTGQDVLHGNFIAAIGSNYRSCEEAQRDATARCAAKHRRSMPYHHCRNYFILFPNNTSDRI